MDRDGDNTIVVDREAVFELLTSNVCDPEGERVRVADESDEEVNDPVAVGTEDLVAESVEDTSADKDVVLDRVTVDVTSFDRETVRRKELVTLLPSVTERELEIASV